VPDAVLCKPKNRLTESTIENPAALVPATAIERKETPMIAIIANLRMAKPNDFWLLNIVLNTPPHEIPASIKKHRNGSPFQLNWQQTAPNSISGDFSHYNPISKIVKGKYRRNSFLLQVGGNAVSLTTGGWKS
jgi:hypothetical protein